MAVIEKEAAAPKQKAGWFSYFRQSTPEEIKEDYESLFGSEDIEEEVLLVPPEY